MKFEVRAVFYVYINKPKMLISRKERVIDCLYDVRSGFEQSR